MLNFRTYLRMEIQTYQIRFDQIIFAKDAEEVNKYCQTPYKNHPNGCPNFQHNWSCPPYAPTVQETRASLGTYTFFWLLIMEIPIPKKKIKIFKKWRTKHEFGRITKHLNDFIDYLQKDHEDWKLFFCSECTLCPEKNYSKCTCPTEPCRYPNKIRISPEAAGIDVFTTLTNLDISIEKNPITKLHRIAMCAADERVNFDVEYKKYETYLSILNKIENL
ncbi:MAG: DUF2284 domain-containing protein [Promethearchaeota archaeon]